MIFFFYRAGKIKAIQLEYSEAHKNLLQAFRKAPQHTAIGFKQAVRVHRSMTYNLDLNY